MLKLFIGQEKMENKLLEKRFLCQNRNQNIISVPIKYIKYSNQFDRHNWLSLKVRSERDNLYLKDNLARKRLNTLPDINNLFNPLILYACDSLICIFGNKRLKTAIDKGYTHIDCLIYDGFQQAVIVGTSIWDTFKKHGLSKVDYLLTNDNQAITIIDRYMVEEKQFIDDYATHQQILIREALKSHLDIMETGCGYYSTPVLVEIAKFRGVKLISFVQEINWARRFDYLIGEHYQQIQIDFANEIPLTQRFGMCFLDHEQLVKDRIKHLNHILEHTDTVVIHDADKVSSFALLHKPYTIEMFKHLTPNTAVIRNV
jgi:hypothetical protein